MNSTATFSQDVCRNCFLWEKAIFKEVNQVQRFLQPFPKETEPLHYRIKYFSKLFYKHYARSFKELNQRSTIYSIWWTFVFWDILIPKKKLGNRHRETRFAKQKFMVHEIVIILSHQLPHSIFRDIWKKHRSTFL